MRNNTNQQKLATVNY